MAKFQYNPITQSFNLVSDAIDLGTAFQGPYDNGTGYTVGQAVFQTGKLYVCLVATTGNPPSDPAYWDELDIQGPQGPAGPEEDTVSFIAGENLGGLRLVTLDMTWQAVYADQAQPSHAGRILGLTLGSAVQGATVTVRRFGLVSDPSWNWNPAQGPVFLTGTGQLTQTPPTTGFLCVVSIPVSATELFLHIHPAIQLS